MSSRAKSRKKALSNVHRRRALFSLSLAILTILTVAGNYVLVTNANDRLAASENSHRQAMARLDEQITELKAQRAAAIAQTIAEEVITAADAGAIDATDCNISGKHTDPTSPSVMVNKKHCIQPLTFQPNDLVTVYGATLSQKAADSFSRLYEAASAAGYPLAVTSSYRSYDDQVNTYRYWVSVSGVEGADTYSARPGYSEHQTGFALDVADTNGCSLDCFGSTPHYQWLQTHAADYGFIQRYYAGSETITGYSAEEWHYRYVGTQTAQDMKRRGIKTLEEYWRLPGGLY